MPVTQQLRFEKRATAFGSYYTSRASKRELLEYLADARLDRFKFASIGGEQEQGFEQAFSSLAYAYLKDKAPRLLDFIVGFQLVDRNEDNTKACGLFGFKVGDQWLYAPVFFLNGDLKGHELLYIKKQDCFVPMKENWVNSIISRKPHALGKGSEKNTHELGGLQPNLMRMSRPPTGYKYGEDDSDAGRTIPVVTPTCECGKGTCERCRSEKLASVLPIHVDGWARPFLPALFALMTKRAAAFYPGLVKGASELDFAKVVASPFGAALRPESRAFDMRNFLSDFPLLKMAYEKCYSAYPAIKKGFDTFYGNDFFAVAAGRCKERADDLTKLAESYIVPPAKGKKKKSRYILPEIEKTPFNKNANLEVIALDVSEDEIGQVVKNKPELTEEERERLLHDTVLIKDKRDPHATSMVYNTQLRFEVVNPDETGLFDVLEKPGTFDEMLVLHHPHSGRGRNGFTTVLRKADPRAWKNTATTNLWMKQNRQLGEDHFRDWWDKLSSTTSLQKGGTYVAVYKTGESTCPFTVVESYDDKAYRVEWHDRVVSNDRPAFERSGLQSQSNDWDLGYQPWNSKLVIGQHEGSKLRSGNNELTIPKGFKILKLKDPPKAKKDDIVSACIPHGFDGESEEHPIQPGNLLDVQLALQKQATEIRLHDTGGNEVWLKSPAGNERMSKRAALISLVRDHGIREGQAREMLKEAAAHAIHNRPAMYFVKYAYGYGLDQGAPTAPAFPGEFRGTEPSGSGSVSSIYPQEELLPVDSLSAGLTDPSTYDPYYTPDTGSMAVAQQAAMSGQKEVFDTSMISGLLKAVRQDSLVDKHLGDLMKALDRLGRLLAMFYWHQEEFEDRYGKQDIPELEDSLRNAFETLGDVVLFLKEKSVQGAHGINAGIGPGNSDAEPNVTEAARN